MIISTHPSINELYYPSKLVLLCTLVSSVYPYKYTVISVYPSSLVVSYQKFTKSNRFLFTCIQKITNKKIAKYTYRVFKKLNLYFQHISEMAISPSLLFNIIKLNIFNRSISDY